jgi:hypothetical protein
MIFVSNIRHQFAPCKLGELIAVEIYKSKICDFLALLPQALLG